MNKHYIKLHYECEEEKETIIIKLNSNVENWHKARLELLTKRKDKISGITIGPYTVIEGYKDDELREKRKTIVNDTEEEKKWEIGCEEKEIKSFRIWKEKRYNMKEKIKYCENDKECKEYEICMCKGGERREEWCRKEKRRCMHRSNLLHESERKMRNKDKINKKCMEEEMRKIKKDQMEYKDMKRISKKCYEGEDKKEGEYSLHYYYKPEEEEEYMLGRKIIEEFKMEGDKKKEYIIIISMIGIILGIITYVIYKKIINI